MITNNIALFSVPRSGSTWLGQILNSAPDTMYRFQPNFAYSFPKTLNKESDKKEIEKFHKELKNCEDPFVCGELSISSKKNVEFAKENISHLIWKETHFIFLAETLLKNSDTKVIGLIRSPFATISSWLKIPKEFDPSWDVEEQWRNAELKNQGKESHYFGFEKWKEATLLFDGLKKEYPNRFYLVNYDDLLHDTIGTVTNLFHFAGLEVSNQTQQFIKKSRTTSVDDAYGVFKKKEKDDGWKGELLEEIVNEIKEDKDFQKLNTIFKWI
ncbi:MAG TPA: sulfotransferase domain-containing protein [Salinimicrobium sp.]|nr:sulfotransferase domain-containing protein [Salinimicrobium sp.]